MKAEEEAILDESLAHSFDASTKDNTNSDKDDACLSYDHDCFRAAKVER
jgi:hypothetical protein